MQPEQLEEPQGEESYRQLYERAAKDKKTLRKHAKRQEDRLKLLTSAVEAILKVEGLNAYEGDALVAQLAQASEQAQIIWDAYPRQQALIAQLRVTLANKDEEYANLKAQFDQLNQSMASIQNQIAPIQERNSNLETENKVQRAECSHWKEQHSHMQSLYDEAHRHLEELQRQHETIVKDKDTLGQRLQDVMRLLASKSAEVDDATFTVKSWQDKYTQLQALHDTTGCQLDHTQTHDAGTSFEDPASELFPQSGSGNGDNFQALLEAQRSESLSWQKKHTELQIESHRQFKLLQEQYDDVVRDNGVLANSLEDITRALAIKSQEVDDAVLFCKENHSELQTVCDEARNKLEGLQAQYDACVNEMHELDRKLGDVTRLLGVKSEETVATTLEANSWKEKHNQLQDLCSEARINLENLQVQYGDCVQEKCALDRKVKEMDQALQDLTSKLDEKSKHADEAQTEISSWQEKHGQLQTLHVDACNQLECLQARYDTCVQEKTVLGQKLEEITNDLAQKSHEVDEATIESSLWREKHIQLQILHDNACCQLENLQVQHNATVYEKCALEQRLQDATSELSLKSQEVIEARDAVGQLLQQVTANSSDKELLDKRILDLECQINDLEASIVDREKTLSSCREELGRCQMENKHLAANLEIANEELVKHKEDVVALNSQITNLRDELAQASEREKQINEQIFALQEERDNAFVQVARMRESAANTSTHMPMVCVSTSDNSQKVSNDESEPEITKADLELSPSPTQSISPTATAPDLSSIHQIPESIAAASENMVEERGHESKDRSLKWIEVMAEYPPPPYGLESPVIDHLIGEWSTEAKKVSFLREWLHNVCFASDATHIPKDMPMGVQLLELTPEVKDGFLMLLVPIVKSHTKWHVRVYMRNSSTPTPNAPPNPTPDCPDGQLWDLRIKLSRPGASAATSLPLPVPLTSPAAAPFKQTHVQTSSRGSSAAESKGEAGIVSSTLAPAVTASVPAAESVADRIARKLSTLR